MTFEKFMERVNTVYGSHGDGPVRVELWVKAVCRESYFLGKKAGRAEERRKLSKRIGVKP